MPGGIHPPLDVIASWPAANYVNPQTRGWGLVVLACVLAAITLLAVSARLWARFVLQHNSGLDDYFIITAMIPVIGFAVLTCLASRRFGFDRHIWDLHPGQAVQSRKAIFAMELTYIPATSLTKISILLFYRRLAANSLSRPFLYIVYASIVSVAVYMVTFVVAIFFTCRPMAAMWMQVDLTWAATHEGQYQCLDEEAALMAAAIISIVQDFLACALPTMLFWKLQIPLRQKVLLSSIFAVGFFLCLTGIFRLLAIDNLFTKTYDTTWAAESVWAWTAVETHLGVVCASAPALKPFFRRYLSGSTASGSGSRSGLKRSGYAAGYRRGRGRDEEGLRAGAQGSSCCSRAQEEPGWKEVELGRIAVVREVELREEREAGRHIGVARGSGELESEGWRAGPSGGEAEADVEAEAQPVGSNSSLEELRPRDGGGSGGVGVGGGRWI